MFRWRILAPVAAFAVTGCLASKADIVLLQDEIRTLRAMQARSDSSRRAWSDSVITLALRTGTGDSLRALSQRFSAFQANVGGELFEIGRQLITIQELSKMDAKSLMQVRSSLEERIQSMNSDTTAAPPAPGPAQIFSASFDQYRRGSFGTARAGFEELLKRYPDFDQASAAQLHIASIFESEKKLAEADSTYLLVVSKYPKSNDAPTALFKFGVSRQGQGKTADARDAFQRLIREYSRSTEAELAADRLKAIK